MSRRRGRRVQEGRERLYKGDRIIRIISAEKAVQLLNQKMAVCYRRADGVMDGVQLVPDPREIAAAKQAATADAARALFARKHGLEADPRRSCVVLSKSEAEAVAERRKSRTGRLTHEQRDARVAAGFKEMDFAEAARRKFHAMFPNREPEPTF